MKLFLSIILAVIFILLFYTLVEQPYQDKILILLGAWQMGESFAYLINKLT